MRLKRYRWFFTVLFSILSLNLFCLDIRINNTRTRQLSSAETGELLRQRPVNGVLRSSLTLEELLPLFYSVDSIRILDNVGNIHTALPENMSEFLYCSYLVQEQNGELLFISELQLSTGVKQLPVEAIEIDGELIDTPELEVWVSWEGVPELKAEIHRWGRLHGVRITVNEVPRSDSKLLSILRGGDRPPDVLLLQSDYLPPLTAARALQPVAGVPVEEFAPKGLEAFTVDGRLWAVPFYCDAQMIFYRTDLLPSPLPSGSWNLESFRSTLRQLKARGISPATWNAYSAYWLMPFLSGFGKMPLTASDGSIRADDEATHRAVGFLMELAAEGLLDLKERDSMFSRFLSGDTALMLSASFSIPELQRLDIPFGVVVFPEGPEGPMRPLLDFKGFAITRKTRNPVTARRFLRSMSDPAVQYSFADSVYKLPVAETAWELTRESNPWYEALLASYRMGLPVPSTAGYKIYKNTMWKMLRFLLNGQMPVEQGLQQAQRLIENQLAQ